MECKWSQENIQVHRKFFFALRNRNMKLNVPLTNKIDSDLQVTLESYAVENTCP